MTTTNSPGRLSLRGHQSDALTAVCAEMAQADRANVVMACGTGKTLLELHCAEALSPSRVLVFVPSLHLLRQSRAVWNSQNSRGPAYRTLCVCSDPTIDDTEEDEIVLSKAELGFPTTTDPEVVSAFIESGQQEAMSVVFCTYQSGAVVGQALNLLAQRNNGQQESFDVGIFDEAHRTVGATRKSFAFALFDNNISIKKRLFFTATPRVIKNGMNNDGDLRVLSMDDITVYGSNVYTLSFAEAARRKIITPYKIVVSVINDGVAAEGVQRAKDIAVINSFNMKALNDTMNKFHLKKAITFHSTIHDAQLFSNTKNLGNIKTATELFHVSGRQNNTERLSVMRRFASSEVGVISNARCLTEGVDIPAVDLVGFMSPKSSKVDIVQAIGRAMRNSPGKTCCYIFLPLHIDTRNGESVEAALERSNFKEIAYVLSSMSENDTALHDQVRLTSMKYGQDGQSGLSESIGDGLIEFMGLDGIDASTIFKSIQVRLLAEIGVTWDIMYGKLKKYKEYHGDCEVARRHPELGAWVAKQRELAKDPDSYMFAERYALLQEIGFRFEIFESNWDNRFEELKCFLKKHKNKYPASASPLGKWVSKQRYAFKNKKIPKERLDLLNSIKFDFDAGLRMKVNAEINAFMKNLDYFKWSMSNNNGRIDNLDYKNLIWLKEQSELFNKGDYPKDRALLLIQSGFNMVFGRAEIWQLNYLEALHNMGTLRGIVKDDPSHRWLKFQRKKIAEGKIEPHQLEKLLALPKFRGPDTLNSTDRQDQSIREQQDYAGRESFATEYPG